LTDQPDQRLGRALVAFLRQEIQAPAGAVTDFLGMIIEDARALNLSSMLADLDRMHGASVTLSGFVEKLIEDLAGEMQGKADPESFHRQLRHDLRTPLNAIKGYGELLMEDMEGVADHPLRADLIKLTESADHLLEQIDAMIALTQRHHAGAVEDANRARHLSIVADVLRSVEPLHVSPAHKTAHASPILVVDDNPSNRDVLARRLVRDGHRVATAVDGAGALALVAEQAFDLILLDLMMPGMSGLEVLRRLKAADNTRHIPVIVISALDEIDSVVRCIQAGAEDYLTKPFNPVLLRARVEASLEKKLLRDREKQFVADLEREKNRSEALLLNILPASIVARMREGETVIADRIDAATILFCDLAGFTTLSHELPAERMIEFLSRIFSSFDALAAEHGVEKIKTIGDAYMLAAGIPAPQSDHAVRVVALAPRMMAAIDAIAGQTGIALSARIGIHSGPVVAGVIGTHKFVYDVWGDTVNTASRMESHSLPGRIQISAATRAAIGNRFEVEPRGPIEVKGKGRMEAYFLVH
jgi:class 3 adenylate cyclase